MENTLSISKFDIGEGLPTFIIAEIGLNHNGSEKLAHELIDEAVLAGANAVKFQKRTPSALAIKSFLDAPFLKCPQFGRTQRQVREKLELNLSVMQRLKKHSEDIGLVFFISVFDIPSVDFAMELDLQVLKIASHSVTNTFLLEKIAKTKLPLLLSTGGVTEKEIKNALDLLHKNPLGLLHCVSAYPCPDNIINLDTITELKKKYNKLVGYSGHEDGVVACVAAVALGAKIIERHFTLSSSMTGLDHRISLEPPAFSDMVQMIRRVESMHGIKTSVENNEMAARSNYHVAVCAKKNIKKGETLSRNNVVLKQPLVDVKVHFAGTEVYDLLGKKVIENVKKDTQIPRKAVKL